MGRYFWVTKANRQASFLEMHGRPERNEAAPYYFGYIDQVSGDDISAAATMVCRASSASNSGQLRVPQQQFP